MSKYDLSFDPPIMNAAGALGFAPDPRGPVDYARLGAFFTNPISLKPRTPAQTTRFLSHPGGFLLHTGYPNPGLKKILQRYAGRWATSPIPVIVNLLCHDADEVFSMVSRLENVPGVAGLEIGLPPETTSEMSCDMVRAAAGELPIFVRLPLFRADELAPAITATGNVEAFSLAPPRGALPAGNDQLVRGRLYGPGIFPLALGVVQALQHSSIPIIGAGGIYQPEHIEAMLSAGAMGVQLDAVLWRGSDPDLLLPSMGEKS